MDGGAADLDGDDGVEDADGVLKRLEGVVLVWEDAEVVVVDADTGSGVRVFLGRLEPRIPLGLRK